MKLVRNVGVGLANSVWTAALGLAVVPLYLKYLGIEAYGLIGFFATMQALFQILDLGMAPTINREMARSSTNGRSSEIGNLLHTLAVIYWVVAGIICIGMIAVAPIISLHWLKSNALGRETITRSVMLMGLVIACRWPTGLYIGALNGMHRLCSPQRHQHCYGHARHSRRSMRARVCLADSRSILCVAGRYCRYCLR